MSSDSSLKLNSKESAGPRPGVFTEELLKCFECPVCFKYMTAPIHNCVTGHSICSQCMKQGLKQCPVCKAEFGCGRTYLAEELAKHILFPCENKDYGCTVRVLGSELQQHHVTCSYRIRNCFLDVCKWKGRRSELTQHFTNEHPKLIFGSSVYFRIPKGDFTDNKYYYVMQANGELFLWFTCTNSRTRNLTGCVYYIGEAEKATMYTYTVTLKSKDGRRSLCYTDATRNDPLNFDTLTESTELFIANEDTLKAFTDGDGKIHFNIKFSKDQCSL